MTLRSLDFRLLGDRENENERNDGNRKYFLHLGRSLARSIVRKQLDYALGMSNKLSRRKVIQIAGAGAASALAPKWAFAGPFQSSDFQTLIPADKKLSPEWVKSLTERGERTVYRGADLQRIGMPIGGIFAGTVYLAGDGDLWLWDIFNSNQFGISPSEVEFKGIKLNAGGGSAYVKPPKPFKPFQQGFALRVDGKARFLDRRGWADIEFVGEYPIGFVTYRDPSCPVEVRLKAFSPFEPLNPDDSGLPATIMEYTVVNKSDVAHAVDLAGYLQNSVCAKLEILNELQWHADASHGRGFDGIHLSAVRNGDPPPIRPEIVFEDFQKPDYGAWTKTGTAFGNGPIDRSQAPAYQGDFGGPGQKVVNSHASAPGSTVEARDAAVGKLSSPSFTVDRGYINFWIGGGNHPGKTCLNLIVDGKVVRTATGHDSNHMRQELFDVRELAGKAAQLEVVDDETGPWGNIGVGTISFSDVPWNVLPVEQRPDFGTMSLAMIGESARVGSVGGVDAVDEAFNVSKDRLRSQASSKPQVGLLETSFHLAPGQSKTIACVIAWHFPNDKVGIADDASKRHYAGRFKDSRAVVDYIAANRDRLISKTKLWHRTWYDSTLPYWFLDRSMANLTTLATTVCHRFGTGRFWAWEGVGCCVGTCTHVWHYAQAMGRIFPTIERDTRERVDYGVGFDTANGGIGMRAEFERTPAVDGQAGSILRTLREHQMASDHEFLKRVWPRTKQAIQYLMSYDPAHAGIMEGAQNNTLDAAWYGQISWLSSLYVAAVLAGEAMAREMGDVEFAKLCGDVAERGSRNLVDRLYNGEYFVQTPDPAHDKALGTYDCCHIDQVMGQSWAWQVGLPRVTDRDRTLSALQALWKYNFAPDVGPWREKMKEGRWYAVAGDAGLIMTTNPKLDKDPFRDPKAWQMGYFNECMSGFEHQVASHMIAEGMVTEGLAVARAIHDRYSATKRNPYNEIECSDHYSRAMASYGSFVAACGFEIHGPNGHIGFSPRWSENDFRAPFVAVEGWGTFEQKIVGGRTNAKIAVRSGQLSVKTIALRIPAAKPTSCQVTVGRVQIPASLATDGDKTVVALAELATVKDGQEMKIKLE